MHRYRSHTCGQLRDADIGDDARISGWCHRIRDHGGLLFVDLRDHYGLTQVVVDPDSPAFRTAETLRSEWCVRVDGKVRRRPEGTDNASLPTGTIEIFATDIEVLGAAAELPMPVFGDVEYPEETRLKYRFLDLRREKLHASIMTRVAVVDSIRQRMKAAGFNEFQTPILTASSPEGARDFLVPSRLHPGQFYALPQAPQQYKQLLMMAGFDRYFQIAPCFRDEDPRADRFYGEFYQLDLEMSFVTQDDVFATMEPVITGLFEQFAEGKPVTKNWPRIPYAESLRKYGSDKPDLRNPIEMQDVSEHFRGSGFKVFARMLDQSAVSISAGGSITAGGSVTAGGDILAGGSITAGGQITAGGSVASGLSRNQVWAIPAKGGGSRAFCDRMNSWAQGEGQPGLGYVFWKEGSGSGPIANNIGPERTSAIREALGLGDGDAAFFVAGDPEKFYRFAGAARLKVGLDLGLTKLDSYEFAWIVDFPMYEWNEDEKKIDFSHNPFSMPQGGLEALKGQDPLTIKAFQYDIACNGYEIASGGIRNHRPEAMVKAFEIAGYGEQEVIDRFGGMFRAFQYGAPPHGGMAAGVDRIVMLLCGAQNLREVALFPMNQQAVDLLMGAPTQATNRQLRELHIRPVLPEA